MTRRAWWCEAPWWLPCLRTRNQLRTMSSGLAFGQVLNLPVAWRLYGTAKLMRLKGPRLEPLFHPTWILGFVGAVQSVWADGVYDAESDGKNWHVRSLGLALILCSFGFSLQNKTRINSSASLSYCDRLPTIQLRCSGMVVLNSSDSKNDGLGWCSWNPRLGQRE